jgi:hypothetical protein
MKHSVFLIFFIFIISDVFSQNDSLWVTYPGDGFNLPISSDRKIVYQNVYEFNEKTKSSEIYSCIKPSLAEFYNRASIGLNDRNSLFKEYSDNPVIYEDKESGKISLQLSFRSVKHDNEPESIKDGLIIYCKADFIIRENKLKMIIKNINFYFQSTGVAILIGRENSLLKGEFDNFKDKLNESGFLTPSEYLFKRIFTVDFKIRKLFEEVQARIKNCLDEANF